MKFKDETGNFRAPLGDDPKGLLNLYEASFFGLEGETIIDEARVFATTQLKKKRNGDNTLSFAKKIDRALVMPLHWTLNRLDARWYIETCQEEKSINPIVLEFAKLDYNMVQAGHLEEARKLAKWWEDTDISKISFARDRLVEHYIWCCGMICEPKYREFREIATKIICCITTIDDVYDVYGTVGELELVTDIIKRWDITEIDKLPGDIQICLLALYNITNDIGRWFLKERGFNIIPFLSKAWANQCKPYLKEAKWYYGGHQPTLDEYLANGRVSIGGHLMLFCAYFTTINNVTEEGCNDLVNLSKVSQIMYNCTMIFRITDDLGTSSMELARGDNAKALGCYMNETGASEEEAREYMDYLVHKLWKSMNKELMTQGGYPFREPFLSAHPNLNRIANFFYQFGDGHGFPHDITKDRLMSFLFEPIPLNNK